MRYLRKSKSDLSLWLLANCAIRNWSQRVAYNSLAV